MLTDVWELHGVLDKEDRDVVPHHVPVALFGVKFDGKTSHIANGICTATAAQDGRKPQEDGGGARRVIEDAGLGDIRSTFEELEGTESTGSSSVNYSLGDSLMVKPMYLGQRLAENALLRFTRTNLLSSMGIFE